MSYKVIIIKGTIHPKETREINKVLKVAEWDYVYYKNFIVDEYNGNISIDDDENYLCCFTENSFIFLKEYLINKNQKLRIVTSRWKKE